METVVIANAFTEKSVVMKKPRKREEDNLSVYVLGVDPGAVSGWALVRIGDGKPRVIVRGETGRRYQSGGKRLRDPSGGQVARWLISDAIAVVPHEYLAHEVVWFACEGQFIPDQGGKGQCRRAHAVDALTTAQHAGGWLYTAQAAGLEVYQYGDSNFIPPNVWRLGQWGKGIWRSEQAKKHAVKMAKLVFGVELLQRQHHTAEAMFIAAYAGTEILYRMRHSV
jgi:hypothetical protein